MSNLAIIAFQGGKMRSKVILCLLFLVPALFLGAESAALATHTNAKFTYRLEYPADWQVRNLSESGFFEATSQMDKASLPNTFRVDISPLEAYGDDFGAYMLAGVAKLRNELTAQGSKDIRIISSAEFKLGKLPAQRIDYQYTVFGSLALRSILVRVPHRSWQYTLTCSSEEGWYFDQAVPDYERILASFKIQLLNQDYLDDYIRTRASLSGEDCVIHWKGKAYSYVPGERRKELFDVEGYNIVRAVPDERGYLLLGKEVMLFLNGQSGEILETWINPISGKNVPVLQVFNDPANMDLRFSDEQLQMLHLVLPSTQMDEQVVWNHDLFPFYPNALSRRDYPLFSQSDSYQAADISQFMVNKRDLQDLLQESVPAAYSFTRIYPWLPFMRMGERPGNLILSCRGQKLAGGFGDLPQSLRDYVLATNPGFAKAPDVYSQPNETIWTSFKKQAELGQIDRLSPR